MTDSAADDLRHCKEMLRLGSRSFHLASFLLPERIAAPVTAFYAFCRRADDAIDTSVAHEDALTMLQARLDGIFSEQPLDFPEDRAFSRVVRTHRLPRAPLDALLEGFSWDASGRSYQTLSELTDYAARVAGSVGVIMALIMGESRAAPLARALDLGVAMQLTNICRDVGEDARMGRVYLPIDALQEAGVNRAQLRTDPVYSDGVGAVVRTLLERADALYSRAHQGIAELPLSARFSMRAAAMLYQEIGHELRRAGCDSVSRRTAVRRPRQLLLIARSLLPIRRDSALLNTPVLPECAFLHSAAISQREQSSRRAASAESHIVNN